jgi:hypothetical protein
MNFCSGVLWGTQVTQVLRLWLLNWLEVNYIALNFSVAKNINKIKTLILIMYFNFTFMAPFILTVISDELRIVLLTDLRYEQEDLLILPSSILLDAANIFHTPCHECIVYTSVFLETVYRPCLICSGNRDISSTAEAPLYNRVTESSFVRRGETEWNKICH